MKDLTKSLQNLAKRNDDVTQFSADLNKRAHQFQKTYTSIVDKKSAIPNKAA